MERFVERCAGLDVHKDSYDDVRIAADLTGRERVVES